MQDYLEKYNYIGQYTTSIVKWLERLKGISFCHGMCAARIAVLQFATSFQKSVVECGKPDFFPLTGVDHNNAYNTIVYYFSFCNSPPLNLTL